MQFKEHIICSSTTRSWYSSWWVNFSLYLINSGIIMGSV